MLRPLGKSIIFVFEGVDMTGNKFQETTKSGILIVDTYDHTIKEPRWGTVVSVGKDVEDVEPGQVILIEPLRWTEGFDVDGIHAWMTTEKDVIGIREV